MSIDDFKKKSRAQKGQRRNKLRTARVDEMFLTFLGTSSGAPSPTRNQQALMLQLCGESWLFDCGEASQHRLFGSSSLRSSAVKRIFISHLHGDHCFGLPGMLCNMAVSYGGGEDGEGAVDELARTHLPVEIVGPQGLRSWLRVVLGNSYATLGQMKVIVHELVGMNAIEHGPPRLAPPYAVDRPLPNELPGMDIEPSGNGTWSVPLREHEPPVEVSAVELDHTVPTVGWVVTEAPRAGSVDSKKLLPVLREHGVDRRVVATIKAGIPLELPNGTFLQPSDYVQPSTQRKLAILSDMRKPKGSRSDIMPLLQNATLFVHECTNAYLPVCSLLHQPPPPITSVPGAHRSVGCGQQLWAVTPPPARASGPLSLPSARHRMALFLIGPTPSPLTCITAHASPRVRCAGRQILGRHE